MNSYISTFNSKKFIIFGLLTLIVLLLIQLLILESYTRTQILAKNSQTEKLIKGGDNFTVALLGTSHTIYGSKLEQHSDEIFNYGEAYTYPVVMYAKLKKLIKNAPNLKYLIIEADYHQFYDFSFTTSSIYTQYASLLEDEENKNLNIFFSLDREISPIIHNKILDQIKSVFLNQIKPNVTNKTSFNNWNSFSEKKKNRLVNSRYSLFGFSNNSSMNLNSKNYYIKTIELAVQNDIKVILIRHPLSNEYLDYLYPNIKIDTNDFLNKVSKKYSLEILDYQNIFRYKQEKFSDQDHLNYYGQSDFAKLLHIQLLKSNYISK